MVRMPRHKEDGMLGSTLELDGRFGTVVDEGPDCIVVQWEDGEVSGEYLGQYT
jgi:hypothetical protein